MMVPYLDLTQSYQNIHGELKTAFKRVLRSGWVILGREVKEFEEQYAQFSTVSYCAGVGNGLDALILSLKALCVGPGDEVIVPSNTYIATLVAVSRVGAKPVLAEPKKETYNIDPKEIEKVITKKTKAIIPVHLFGQACQMDKIMAIAKKHHLFVVEDNAQSHGATFKNKITGSFGDINGTSFYPGKNLGAIGDAGAVTTNSKKLYESVILLRNYGEVKKYVNTVVGFNSRLDELQAALLQVRLKHVWQYTAKKQAIAEIYLKELTGVGDLVLPHTETYATNVYHVFPVRTKKRNELQKFLNRKGIKTLIHYPIPPHLQDAYKDLGFSKGSFPISEELADTSLSLPIFPEMTKQQVYAVIAEIKHFYKGQ